MKKKQGSKFECPICNKRASPFDSSNLSVDVPVVKEKGSGIYSSQFYHGNCIQSLEIENVNLKEEIKQWKYESKKYFDDK